MGKRPRPKGLDLPAYIRRLKLAASTTTRSDAEKFGHTNGRLLWRTDAEWRDGLGHYLSALVLVAVRLSGLMVFAPIFSSGGISTQVKAVFLLAMSVLLAPVVAALPSAHAELGVGAIAGELGVGLLFGFLLSLVDEMLSFTGQVLGFQFSFSLVNLLDPNSAIQTPLLGQMFTLFGTLVLIAAGLDRVLLAAVLRSFAAAPVGGVLLSAHYRTGNCWHGRGHLRRCSAAGRAGAGGDPAGRGLGRPFWANYRRSCRCSRLRFRPRPWPAM